MKKIQDMFFYWEKNIKIISSDMNSVELFQAAQKIVPLTDSLVQNLQKIVGDKNVSEAMAIREQHGKDESYHTYVENKFYTVTALSYFKIISYCCTIGMSMRIMFLIYNKLRKPQSKTV